MNAMFRLLEKIYQNKICKRLQGIGRRQKSYSSKIAKFKLVVKMVWEGSNMVKKGPRWSERVQDGLGGSKTVC